MAFIFGIAVSHNSELFDAIWYGQDSYGQFCGKKGTATADLDKVLFPDLDGDIARNKQFFITNPWWEYHKILDDVTRLCVKECPSGPSFEAPREYGGPDYPIGGDPDFEGGSGIEGGSGSGAHNVPVYQYTYKTRELVDYCLPETDQYTTPDVRLCAKPSCSDAMRDSVGITSCLTIDSFQSVNNTWEICAAGTSEAMCIAQQTLCSYELRMEGLQRFVLPDHTTDSDKYTKRLTEYFRLLHNVYKGVYAAAPQIIAFGLCMPLAIGFLWGLLLYLFAAVIVWTLIIFLLTGMAMLTTIFFAQAGYAPWTEDLLDVAEGSLNGTVIGEVTSVGLRYAELEQGVDSMFWLGPAAICLVITLLIFIFVLVNLSAIRRAIAIIEEMCKVVSSIPILLIWPIFSMPIQFGLIGFGCVGILFVMYPETDQDDYLDGQTAIMSLVFGGGIIWCLQFVKAFEYMSMATAVVDWYVNQPNEWDSICLSKFCSLFKGCGIGKLFSASFLVASFHLGSIAVGSFIITVCKLINLLFSLLDWTTKDWQKENFLLRMLMKCVRCAIWCIEKCIEFVSYYAYIYVAMQGCSFCTGAKDTFTLIAQHPGQTAINQVVNRLLGCMLTISTPLVCGALLFWHLDDTDWFERKYGERAVLIAVCITVVAAFLISSSVAGVYSCIMDTLYLSAFKDMKENKPLVKHMSDDMRLAFALDKEKADFEAGKSAKEFRPIKQRSSIELNVSATRLERARKHIRP
eukprot:CAMPEP_0119303818 /NCGR_PEP_ID=MMETSP1333-20130426/5197_1 /TAXON_ID=418940 /ORGANISM="Scyphosphaera apsteinii, Strain RCC1455" /LENGTH=741 /DNA_ID=CAMNT_0007306587 /DNA_START=157 /DNA_END=2382 /DNA_ORIENTATION=-